MARLKRYAYVSVGPHENITISRVAPVLDAKFNITNSDEMIFRTYTPGWKSRNRITNLLNSRKWFISVSLTSVGFIWEPKRNA